MKNKWFQVTVAVVIWGFIANSSFSHHGGMIGRFMHRTVGRVLPPEILGIPSLTIVFIIFTVIFARLAYLFIFNEKEEPATKS